MVHDGNGRSRRGRDRAFCTATRMNAPRRAARRCLSGIRRRPSANVGVWGRGSGRARRDPNRRRSRVRKPPSLPPTRNITGTFRSVGADDRLPIPAAIRAGEDRGPSVNTVAIAQIDLDARIAAAFADGAKSNDVAILIKDTEHGAASASDQAEQARNHALDPTLSGSELKDARKCMDDAAFKRDRLQAAMGKLRERLAELKDQEENARRQVAYDKAEAVRDELAKELADLYPAFAQKLVELLPRIAANDRRDRVHQWPCLAIRSRSVCLLPNSRHAACPVGS